MELSYLAWRCDACTDPLYKIMKLWMLAGLSVAHVKRGKTNEHQLIVRFTMRVSTQQYGTWFGSYICLVAVHLCVLYQSQVQSSNYA